MVRLLKTCREYIRQLLPLVIVALAVFFAVIFGHSTLKLPLLGDHCMKTSKTIEVAYNIVRYRDPLNHYADWKATPDNQHTCYKHSRE